MSILPTLFPQLSDAQISTRQSENQLEVFKEKRKRKKEKKREEKAERETWHVCVSRI